MRYDPSSPPAPPTAERIPQCSRFPGRPRRSRCRCSRSPWSLPARTIRTARSRRPPWPPPPPAAVAATATAAGGGDGETDAYDSDTGSSAAGGDSTTTTTAAEGRRETTISGFAFEGTITVTAGTEVVWTDLDGAGHTVAAREGAFDSGGTLERGQSFSFTFHQPGDYQFYCEIHPSMTGTVVVQ